MIGIFDSGVGGLTVVKEMFRQLPQYQIVYFGDTARTPYGTKGNKTISRYAVEDAEFLVQKGAKIIIVACNTVSSVAYDLLRERFYVPIFEVITPAVRKAVALTKNKRIGVIGTPATIESLIYDRLIKKIDSEVEIFYQACPLLVPLVEENWLKKPETKMIVRKYLYPLKLRQIDTLILGCTHYPLLREIIQEKIGRRVQLVDPAEETVTSVRQFLEKNPEIEQSLAKNHEHAFYLSDLTSKFRVMSREWLGKSIQAEEVEVS